MNEHKLAFETLLCFIFVVQVYRLILNGPYTIQYLYVSNIEYNVKNVSRNFQSSNFVSMDYPIHIDTISRVLSILYFKRLLVKHTTRVI